MKQRVNIQYSIEVKDIQKEVDRLYLKATERLSKVNDRLQSPYISMDLFGMRKIDEARQELATVDAMLGDIHNILQGYVHYKSAPLEPPALPSVAPIKLKDETLKEKNMDSLKEKITHFRDAFDEDNLKEKITQWREASDENTD